MANYNVLGCLDGLNYTVSADTLSPNELISFYTGEENPICGTVVDEATEYEYTHLSTYTECCECYTGSSYLSFEFGSCPPEATWNLDISNFCNLYGNTPTIGQVFKIYDSETDTVFCAEFIGLSTTEGSLLLEPDSGEGPFSTCDECENYTPPRSANTEVLVCEICCDCGATGSTINQITPPHPVWTDGYGTPVTQLNMIVLGGINGLNS